MATRTRIKGQEFVQGGLINDVDVTVKEARYVMYDYEGKSAFGEACCCKFVLVDGDGNEHSNYWSVGGSKEGDFVPSKNGKYLESLNGRTSLAKGSNYQIMVSSLEDNCKMPEGFLNDDLSVIEGAKLHCIRQAAPKRQIAGSKEPKEGEREKDILIFSTAIKAPWGKGGSKTSTSSSSKASSSNDGDDDNESDVETTVKKLVLTALAENDGTMVLSDLGIHVYREATASGMAASDRKKVMPLLTDEDWVAGINGVTIDGDNAVLG